MSPTGIGRNTGYSIWETGRGVPIMEVVKMEEKVKWGTTNLNRGYRFSARIEKCEWLQNQYGKKQLNISLVLTEPMEKAGEIRTIYLPYSDSIKSKWGIFQSQLETLPLPVEITKIDEPEKWLVGKIFVWEQRKETFMDKETNVTVPVKYIGTAISEEEKADGHDEDTDNTDVANRILEHVKKGDSTVDDIISNTGISADAIVSALSQLETEKKIVIKRGGIIHATEI